MSNSILAAGSHIPAHVPLAGGTPTLHAARGVLPGTWQPMVLGCCQQRWEL